MSALNPNLKSADNIKEKASVELLKQIKESNRQNSLNYDTSATSNAANYKSPLNSQVNPRTGELQLTLSPPFLAGFLGSDITPSIFYQQGKVGLGEHMLGLPLGWSYPFSFVWGSRIFINGQQSYALDSSYDSGMQYYDLKNVSFKTCADTQFPYDPNETYGSLLCFQNGETQYFDDNGRLLGIDDRFSNHVLFYYDRDGDIYNSKLVRIVNLYGQDISFSYQDNGITITYPTGTGNTITFTYLTDGLYLTGYVDPVGNQVNITNNGGIVRNDLISEIDYPNGLKTIYDYTAIQYHTDPTDFAQLDAIASVNEEYNNQTKTIQYNYDPQGDAHNYTGYPTYVVDSNDDALLQSNDNSFRYATQVDDGIFVTEHIYNFLHLELETKIFTKANLNAPINYIINTYVGEDDEQCFPPYYQLPINYQTPSSIVTEAYNDLGEKRTYKVESVLDDYGNPTDIKSYQSITTESGFTLANETLTTYDYDHYGLVLQRDIYDYTQDAASPSICQEIYTLTTDGKNIETSTNGLVENNTFKPNQKVTFQYDSQGRVTYKKLEWADGQDHGNLTSTEEWTGYSLELPFMTITHTDAQKNQSKIQVDATVGWVLNEINALGKKTIYSYDNLGRKLSVTSPLGLTTTKWIYDDKGNKTTTQYANGYETYEYCDGFGQTTQTADNMGVNNSERVLSKKTYNAKGQLITDEGILGENSKITYGYDDRGNVASKTDALGNVAAYTYDVVAQNKTAFFNGQKISEASYNLNVTTNELYSTSSSDKIESSQDVNAYNKIVQQILGDKATSSWYETTYTYDVDMNVSNYCLTGADSALRQHQIVRDLFANPIQETVNFILPKAGVNNKTTSSLYTYNNLNQLIEGKNALNQSYYYTYDPASQQITYTDYAGIVFTSTYDADGKITVVSYQDKTGTTHEKKFTYDPQTSNLLSLENFSNNVSKGPIQYTYSLDSKLISITYPDKKTIGYKYDDTRGVLDQFTDALGQTTQYTYNDYGRLVKVQIIGTNYTTNLTYYTKEEDPANSGKIKTVLTNNGVQKTYTYNGYGAINTVTITDTTLQSNNTIAKIVYTYDDTMSNIVVIQYASTTSPQDKNLNYSVEYSYNSINQLSTETLKDSFGKQICFTQYIYDAAGNLTSESKTGENGQVNTAAYVYDADNKLISVQKGSRTSSLTYDVNGNLVDDGEGSTFVYNENGHLISYQNKNQNIQAIYSYYPDGMRATKQINNGDVVRFYYDGSETALIVNEIQASKSTSYLIDGNIRYVRLVKNQDQVVPQYAFTNGKDTIGILDESNKPKDTYNYAPYGELRNASTQPASMDISDNPFLYTAEYTDIESNLIYLRARYYNPVLRRFMSRDSISLLNHYLYADSNPIMNMDPTGHMPQWLSDVLGGVTIVLSGVAIAAGVALVGTGFGAGVGAALIASGVLGVASGSTAIAAANTSGKVSQDLNYASMGLGIGSAITGMAAGAGGFSMAATVENAAAVSTGAAVSVEASTRVAYGTMIGSGVLGVGADSTGIAAQATNNETLGDVSMGLGIASTVVGAVSLGAGFSKGQNGGYFAQRPVSETYYRRMDIADANNLLATRQVNMTRETCISPSRAYSERFGNRPQNRGVVAQIKVRYGTTNWLEAMGARQRGLARYLEMRGIEGLRKWPANNIAMFKSEGGIINIGLGRSGALALFNRNIISAEIL